MSVWNKRALILGLCAMMAFGTGCGDSEETGETPVESEAAKPAVTNDRKEVGNYAPVHEMNFEELLELPDYTSLQLNIPKMDEAMVERYTYMFYRKSFPIDKAITEGTIEEGMTINLDYRGREVGVEYENEEDGFKGGVAKNKSLTIGSHEFIDGFEAGLVGAQVGDEVLLELTFPADYYNADLAGKDVTFLCKINYIYPDGFDEEIIQGMNLQGVTNEQELKNYVTGILNASQYKDQLPNLVIDALVRETNFKSIPLDFLEAKKNYIYNMFAEAAEGEGVSVDEYIMNVYAKTTDELITGQAEVLCQGLMAAQAVANLVPALQLTDEGFEEMLLSVAKDNGYDDVETFLKEGANGSTRNELREQMVLRNTVNYLQSVVKLY